MTRLINSIKSTATGGLDDETGSEDWILAVAPLIKL